MSFQPQLVLVDANLAEHPRTRRILRRCRRSEVRLVSNGNVPAGNKRSDSRRSLESGIDSVVSGGHPERMSLTQGKKVLWLTTHQGAWLKKCPGTAGQVCCNYYILHQAGGCRFDCSYCFLQGYQNNPVLQHHVNLEDGLAELSAALKTLPGMVRLGTGEYTDSLNLDHLTDFSLELLEFSQTQKNLWVEFKTKGDYVENILKFPANGRVVVGFSLMPAEISKQVDHKTATVAERLSAAARVAAVGHRVAIHLDPMIRYGGWEQGYADLIAQISAAVPFSALAWVSLGSLRFTPELKKQALFRMPNSSIFQAEFLRGDDGKMHYLRPVRVGMYRHVLDHIRRHWPRALTYLCMESPEVWEGVFGFKPACGHTMGAMFDERLSRPSAIAAAPAAR